LILLTLILFVAGIVVAVPFALLLGWNPYVVQYVVMSGGFLIWLARKMKAEDSA
jgi:hypothetical protein